MNKFTWILLAMLSGVFLPIQGGLNAKLGKTLSSPLHASMISFHVGATSIALFILFTNKSVLWEGVKVAPKYVWLAGVLGAFYVTVIILAFPILGPGLTFSLVVAGQMISSLVMEHFNILVSQQNLVNPWRLLGITMVIFGVVIFRYK